MLKVEDLVVGKKYKIVRDYIDTSLKGEICTVTSKGFGSTVYIDIEGGQRGRLMRISPEDDILGDVEEATEGNKFKLGDKVLIRRDSEYSGQFHGVGEIVGLQDIGPGTCYNYPYQVEFSEGTNTYRDEDLELAYEIVEETESECMGDMVKAYYKKLSLGMYPPYTLATNPKTGFSGIYALLNKEQTKMETLKNGVKKLTDELTKTLKRLSPEYRDLYRAGFINGDLEETAKYHDVMMELLYEDYREDVTAIAKAQIAEAEKEAKAKK